MSKFRDWLRIGRVQTFPASWLLVIVPFLHGRIDLLQTIILSIFMWLAHFASFGHNSLLDTALGYDLKDPSKKHHPLVAGRISLHEAHNVIHWSLCILAVLAILISLWLSPSPLIAVVCIFLWFVFGYSYNSGLDKESLFSFVPISICFTAMGAWGWYLSHSELTEIGLLYIAYTFFTILFQIGWSGHLKEMQIKERSNFLIKLGARITAKNGEKYFSPGASIIFAYLTKAFNIIILCLLAYLEYSLVSLVWSVLLILLISLYLHKLTRPRFYVRGKELFNMSIMEICTIYAIIPMLLPLWIAAVLMLAGVLYFFLINLVLWGTPYPRV